MKLPADMDLPPIVSSLEGETAREELLVKEKELTRARDARAAERRRMPRMAVEHDYRFEGPNGSVSLGDLFEGRHQLIVYRFFYEPGVDGWPEKGCFGCSLVADQVAHPAHLHARDTTRAFVSRAPQGNIERLRARMGWETIPWYTLTDDFDADFGVAEWHGTTPSSATTTGSSARTSSTPVATRRWAAPGLPRHHRARAPGGVGGLAGGLPADAAVHVVEAPRRVRRAGQDGGGHLTHETRSGVAVDRSGPAPPHRERVERQVHPGRLAQSSSTGAAIRRLWSRSAALLVRLAYRSWPGSPGGLSLSA